MLKSLGIIAFYFLMIALLIYVVFSVFEKPLGARRIVVPLHFVADVRDYYRAWGGFNLIDILRGILFFLIVLFGLNVPSNGLAPRIFKVPPYAADMDTAITKLAKLDTGDIAVKQISPGKLLIWHSAKATYPFMWYKENELSFELAVGCNFKKFIFYPKEKSVIAHFVFGRPSEDAEIWVDNGHGLSRIDVKHDGPYIYAAGNAPTLEDATVLKVGFAKTIDHVDDRIDEGNRWDFGNVNPQVVALFPAGSIKSDSEIHNLPIFDSARLKSSNRPGRELFRATPPIKEYLRERMLQNTNGNGEVYAEELSV